MLVHIDASLNVTLRFPEDLKRFSVEIEGSREDLPRIQAAANVAGDLVDADTMWVSQAWLRQAPACAGHQAWQDGLTGMIEFARKHGWIRNGSEDVRAHVVWNPPQDSR
ncbi:hypothetical protein [Cupriavidus consociatus]|uniref:hypothetical protein n=1 Tax=Cupriavidus consociatus TaxID=2821357 RepID=UPI001AE3972F|nr:MULTISPECIES: hypothetical protein [unclassified Cupriavidus]MBP0625402.1 hypothetical protein [Cupriavidus sp. LEh25]MDK2662144.1 hypothetical protein [Cupriavidus sp. LEh21]